MGTDFTWSEEYSVNNETIDNQHKGMLKLAESLPDKLELEKVKGIVMDLYKYTREHFALEEQMMAEMHFPGTKEHRDLHDGLITKLNVISETQFMDDKSIQDFKSFVGSWIKEHILKQDKQWFIFYNNRAG